MARTIKRTFLILFGALAFMFAGFFFTACGVDYSKISLVCDVNYLELEVGEEKEVLFSIENYDDAFSNKITINERTSTSSNVGDQAAIFECTNMTYTSDSRVRVKIVGRNGGDGVLQAKTLEGGKECLVNVKVKQYTQNLENADQLLYVTNGIDFIPNASMFNFDNHTTEKELSYYYFTPRTDFNFNTYYLQSINEAETKVVFVDGSQGGAAEGDIIKFDNVKLSAENKIVLSYNGEETEKPFVDEFYMLSVYKHSVSNRDRYPKILYTISSVHALPSLNVKASGGYLINDQVEFEELDTNDRIVIVPNNRKMRTYVIKLEVENSISSSPVNIEKYTDGTNYLDIDVFGDFDEGQSSDKLTYYWKVSQNSQAQSETSFGFKIFYDVAQDVEVEEINNKIDLVGDIKIAPTAITINGTTEPDEIVLYNYYADSKSGWKELYLGVVSGYNVAPNFDGVYLEYDTELFDITYNNLTVLSGDEIIYTDLSIPFYIRGKNVEDEQVGSVVIHLKSDILEEGQELTLDLMCSIVSGAQIIQRKIEYQGEDFYLDINAGEQDFSAIAYADKRFQGISYQSIGLNDVVEIKVGDTPYVFEEDKYYLNMTLKPIAVGEGRYRIALDNGLFEDFTFKVVRTLQPDTTSIRLADEGNGNVTNVVYSRRSEDSLFNDVLSIEILNASDSGKITFGSMANVVIDANVLAIDVETNNDNVIVNRVGATSVSRTSYRITTAKNGDAEISFALRGQDIENFKVVDAEESIYMNVSSYSLINEFGVKNGEKFASDNIVYFGENAGNEDKGITFNIVAKNEDSNNFYRYNLNEEFVKELYENGIDISEDEGVSYIVRNENVGEPTLTNEKYSNKFVFYYAQRPNGKSIETYTNVTIVKNGNNDSSRTIKLEFASGLMFMGSTFDYIERNQYGEEEARYTIMFSNHYNIGANYGTFNLETLTYVVSDDARETSVLVINANLRQRNLTKKYNMTIRPTSYIAVENISLASSVTKINFSNDNLVMTLGVYTYPSYSTNKKISVEVIRTNLDLSNPDTEQYSDLLDYEIDYQNSESGVYTIRLSCENFYQNHKDEIERISVPLTGVVYIYPKEWGGSYSSIAKYQPIIIEFQYRNGSKANPYMIESANDIVKINANKVKLKSHYEINSVVDMSSIKNFTPIGIVDGELVGFSGTIIGSSSHASITNISITDSNFVAEAGGVAYAGLFAKINEGAIIENVSITGKIDIEGTTKNTQIGLVAAENDGYLINVEARLSKSKVVGGANKVWIGGLVGKNTGRIYQDFLKYSGEAKSATATGDYVPGYRYLNYGTPNYDASKNEYYVIYQNTRIVVDEKGNKLDELGRKVVLDDDRTTILSGAWNYERQTTKNMVYFNDVFEVELNNTVASVGGVAGHTNGFIQRFMATRADFKVYGYATYSAYTLIKVSGVAVGSEKVLYVGGVAGEVDAKSSGDKSCVITNILVGGEVDTTSITKYTDSVGGIMGHVSAGLYSLQKNVSRTFVRGNKNVGGIVGYEQLGTTYNNVATWGTENIIEAIDDGRTAYEAAMIIKNVYEDRITSANPYYFAVGLTNRNYDTSVRFRAYSYLTREKLDTAPDRNNTITTDYYGDYICSDGTHYQVGFFTQKSAEISFAGANRFYRVFNNGTETTIDDDGVNMFFMYYFGVDGVLNGAEGSSKTKAQEEIEDLNFVTTSQTGLYPFELSTGDVSISTKDANILSIDSNGNMSIKNIGLATITLSSILNVNKVEKIYVYVVNYFNKDVDKSIYFTSPTTNGVRIENDSVVNIYGNSSTSIYVVPSYEIARSETSDKVVYHATESGILSYGGVSYVLSKNSFVTTTNESYRTIIDNDISRVQFNKQTIVFRRTDNSNVDFVDRYMFEPALKVNVSVDGQNREYIYLFDGFDFNIVDKGTTIFDPDEVYYTYNSVTGKYVEADITEFGEETYYARNRRARVVLNAAYRETASAIRVNFVSNAIRTNNPFDDYVIVDSTDNNEHLFYQIFKIDEDGTTYLVQERLPYSTTAIPAYYTGDENDLMNITADDLFDLTFVKDTTRTNKFVYTCKVNTDSHAFIDRFNNPIYGDYIVYLYANELEAGVSNYFRIRLDEANVNYIVANNYSNINDISTSDSVVVPSQNGMIEVSVDPIEAIFDTFTISNNLINSKVGAGTANFTFVYEESREGEVEYKYAYAFAKSENGRLTFKYQDMINYFTQLGANVEYKGRIYIGYLMPSNLVEDGVQVAFDVDVSYGNNEHVSTSIYLVTKLSSYAKLSFNNRTAVDNTYYVARGLSYGMTLEYYGFSENQITISSTNASVASVSGTNGRYVLDITSGIINYNEGEPGFKVEIMTVASKVVDNVLISTSQSITIYVMEYVLNYNYIDGVNEDIVSGMRNGVIEDAIGNPYSLSMDVTKFIEYDRTIPVVVGEVNDFLTNLLANSKFKVYYDGTEEELADEKTIKTDYYSIKSKTFTPLKLYNASSNIYHFSVEGYYSMKNGVYTSNYSAKDNLIYSEFSFNVHDQSTEDSPIPVETYQELIDMKDGEWYILTKDIILPNDLAVETENVTRFTPITAEIKGFDGNGHRIIMSGEYTFEDLNSVGLFATIRDEMIVKNVSIVVSNDATILLNTTSFNVGLIAAENEGIITNCEVISSASSVLSVLSSEDAETSYVGGLVAVNSGFITNSHVKANLKTNVNLAGLVGQNGGLIASSFYKGASLENMTGTVGEYVAGLVVTNSGRIYTSYVSGDTSTCEDEIYYNKETNFVASNNNIAGFVYTNSGEIYDCYSNIRINSGAYATGFVFENSGSVERCFSTSVLTNSQTSNYGFAYKNSISSATGTFKDCFYLSDESKNVNISIGEMTDGDGLEVLNVAGFSNMDNFKNYVKTDLRKVNSVWFFVNDNGDDSFNGAKFNKNRLELVAPNIIATSVRELDRIENVVDQETGATYARYVYVYKNGTPALGTIYNPIIITDYETMENYIAQENNAAGFNHSYYRIACDIDYTDSKYGSELYRTIFSGYIEGNFTKISGISLMSNESVEVAGLFGEILSSGSDAANGTIMNLTIEPKIVSYTSANCVGTIAGRMTGGTLINVRIIRSNDQIVATGNNIVGGLVGCAVGNYKMINVYSEIGAKARRQNVSNDDHSNEFSESFADLENLSFAGSYVGVLSGTGAIYNATITKDVSVLADKAGLFFGLVDSNALAENVYVELSSSMVINAYSYGGFVVGETKGTIKDVNVVGYSSNANPFVNFQKVPFVPVAIGGISGLVYGGTISGARMTQAIKVANPSDDKGVEYLGGIAGVIWGNATITDVEMEASLTGFKKVGGIAGAVIDQNGASNYVLISDIKVVVPLIYISGRNLTEICAGGLFGELENEITMEIKTTDYESNSVEIRDIQITTYIYHTDASVFVGAVFGKTQARAYIISNINSRITGGNIGIYDMTKPSGSGNMHSHNYSYPASGEQAETGDTIFVTGRNSSTTYNLTYEHTKGEGANVEPYTCMICIVTSDG